MLQTNEEESFYVSPFELIEDDSIGNFKSFSVDEIRRWIVEEVEDFSLLQSIQKRINQSFRDCTRDLFSILEMKKLFLKYMFKSCPIDVMNDLVVLSSNLYLNFTKFNEEVEGLCDVLFLLNDKEEYSYLPFRELMKNYVQLEDVIKRFEMKLSESLNRISVLTPALKSSRDLSESLELEHRQFLEKNLELEKEFASLTKEISENFVEKGQSMIEEFQNHQIQSNLEMKKMKKLVKQEIHGLGSRFEQFEPQLGSVIIHPDNHFSEKSQSKLYAMQIHLMHLVRKFEGVNQTVEQMQQKLKRMMKEKISGTKYEVRKLQERKSYNLKIKFAKRNVQTFEKEVLPQLKQVAELLNNEIVKGEEKKKGFQILDRNSKEMNRIQTILQEVLISIPTKRKFHPSLHHNKKKEPQINEQQLKKKEVKEKEKMNKEAKETTKKNNNKKKKITTKSSSKKKQSKNKKNNKDWITKQEHSNIISKKVQKIRNMERFYQIKINELQQRIEFFKEQKKTEEREEEEKEAS